MHAKSVTIRNYRSLRNVTVNLDGLTVLIGPNGSGKTSVLRALELFSADAPPVTARDFSNPKKKIRVDLTLSCAGAGRALAPYAIGGEILLRMEYEAPEDPEPGDKATPNRLIRAKLNTDLDRLRGATTKARIEREVETLRKQAAYSDLPAYLSPKKWELAFSRYEREFFARHPHHSAYRPGHVKWDTDLLSPAQVLETVYVPAMRDIAQDGSDGSSSHLGRLIGMAIGYARKKDPKVMKAADERASANARYLKLLRGRIRPRLTRSLRDKARQFVKDASVAVRLDEPPGALPPLRPSVTLRENCHMTDVGHVGGGLQRVYLMALLETIAEEGREAPDAGPDSRARLILIDEPELYQHPQRQRRMLGTLAGMAGGDSPVRVVCSTHSPYFVRLDAVDRLRILRRGRKRVWQTTRKRLVGLMRPRETSTGRGWQEIAKWLDMTATRWATEGFFASLAVVVEGVGDRNVLLAAAGALESLDRDQGLDRQEITIVPAGSVSNVEGYVRLFREFGVRTYAVWDRDGRWDADRDAPCREDQTRADAAAGGEFVGSLRGMAINGSLACIESTMTRALAAELRECSDILGSNDVYMELEKKRAIDEGHAGRKGRGRCKGGVGGAKKATESAQKGFLHDRANAAELLEAVAKRDPRRLDGFTAVRIVRALCGAARAR